MIEVKVVSKNGAYRRTLYPGDKVYVAARWEQKIEARAFAAELMRAGYVVTSRWVWSEERDPAHENPNEAVRWADSDLQDIRMSDVFLLLSDGELGRGGKDFELGYAYALGKRSAVIGPPTHVFAAGLSDVRRYEDKAAFRCIYLDAEKIDALP